MQAAVAAISHQGAAMRWPLRNQIMLPVLAVALASILSVGGVNAWLSARQTRERIELQLRGVADVLTASRFPLTESVLTQMQSLSGADFALVGEGNSIVAATLDADEAAFDRRPNSASGNERSLESTTKIAGREYFHWPVQLRRMGADGNHDILHVFFPCDQYRRAIRSAVVTPLVVSLLSTAAVALVAQIIAGRFGSTTRRLGQEVQRLACGDFAPVTISGRDDELRDLTIAVNRTAERLAEFESQVRHTEQLRTLGLIGAGLAHEMRNAATGCRVALDLHVDECTDGGGETIDVARRQLSLIDSQLKRLLQLGRPGTLSVRDEADLGAIVEDAVALVRPTARHRNVALDWEKPTTEIVADVDADAVHQLVLNLALNAIESAGRQKSVSPDTRRVHIELRSLTGESPSAELTVCDTGPGPDPTVAESLFQPFVTSKPEGVGLGLAVVHQVVEAHNGAIQWERSDERTLFCVTLPMTEQKLSYV